MTPMAGFSPDADPTTQGILIDCSNVIPFEAGFKGAATPVATAAAALAASCVGAAVATQLNGTRRVFAGTASRIYELAGTSWLDRTRLVTLATPGIATGVGSTTGGTLAAATYFVKIVAVDANGNTTAAGPESAGVTTTGTTSSIAYTWAASASAASYRIYYGTAAGAEAAYYTSVTNSFTLTATAGTAGAVPSVAGPVVYGGGPDTRWSYCQFGDTTVAANLADTIQSSASAAFADITGAPKAKIVISASNNFVIAFNTVDATYGTSPDRWWCCAQGDQTSWTPNVATSATTGRLVATEGNIQAALALGSYVVAYKSKGVYLGSFVGSPVVWQWELVQGGEAGCVGQEAVCDIGGAHFFVGNDSFWLFDGTRPTPVGDGVLRQWWLNNSSPQYRYKTKAIYDKQNKLLRVFYPSSAATDCDSCLVLHVGSLRTGERWGRADKAIQAPLNYIAPGVTIDGLNTTAATINALPNIPVDSQFWLSGGQTPSYFDTMNQLVSLTGACAASSLTTCDSGDDDTVSMVQRVRLRFSQSPTTATGYGFYKMNEGDGLTSGPSNAINDGKFDIRQSGRYHRVRVDMTGDHKVTGYDVKLAGVSER